MRFSPPTADRRLPTVVAFALLLAAVGCGRGPHVIDPTRRTPIDRSVVEYPGGFELTPFARGLTAPTAFAFDKSAGEHQGNLIVAESGDGGHRPQLYAFKPDGSLVKIFPKRPTILPDVAGNFQLFAPIGGIAVRDGKIYVSHRDVHGMGVITCFDYDGNHSTVVADLPARGDHAIGDLALHPENGRLYFGLGSATNSGVVGLDNWEAGWVRKYPDFADSSWVNLKLLGLRYTTRNPAGGLFGGDDISATGPFQPFGASRSLSIPAAPSGKPTAAIYSVNPDGGDLRVEAHGIRNAGGLAFDDYGNLYVTNQGMELRGTRPVRDDPDTVLRVPLNGGIWFGWPDYSADLQPVSQARFQPPADLIDARNYPEIRTVIDREASALLPADRSTNLRAVFPSQSGASKMVFVPTGAAAFEQFDGQLIVALKGDRAPFATSGQPLVTPPGYAVVRVDTSRKETSDFVFNPSRKPAHEFDKTGLALERPVAVTFGPDGALYILDYGRLELRRGQQEVSAKTGKIYRLGPVPTTRPATVRDE